MAELILKETAQTLIVPRPVDGHKGTFGHVLVLGGSRAYVGAPLLAANAASRSGVGLVTLGVPETVWPHTAPNLGSLIGFSLPETDSGTLSVLALKFALERVKTMTAAVLGPGLGRHPETTQFVAEWLRLSPVPTVLDADALNAISEDVSVLKHAQKPLILTPHPGEMARLMGTDTSSLKDSRDAVAMAFSDLYNVTLILKGNATVIASPGGRISVNTTGNDGLAKGGTGDVLAGLLGGLLAQGMEPYDAARLGVYLHGLAGEIAATLFSKRGMTALDVSAMLTEAWKSLEAEDEIS